MKFYIGGIPYLPVREAWNGTGEAISFNKGVGEEPSRQVKQQMQRLKGKLWRNCWAKKIMLFQECLKMCLKRSSHKGLECHLQKLAFES